MSRKTALIVIPCFRESRRLPGLLNQMLSDPWLVIGNGVSRLDSNLPLSIHLMVTDDGSPPQEAAITEKIVHDFNKELSKLNVAEKLQVSFHRFEKNAGKGRVLQKSFLAHRLNYDYLGFLDGDGATSFGEMKKIIHCLHAKEPKVDAVFASRWKALGRSVDRTWKRHLLGRVFATILAELFDIPVYDSQCGAKIFRAEILTEEILSFCDNPTWLFDTQLLLVLYKLKKQVLEFPIDWQDVPGSKVSLLMDPIKMLYKMLRFYPRWKAFQPSTEETKRLAS